MIKTFCLGLDFVHITRERGTRIVFDDKDPFTTNGWEANMRMNNPRKKKRRREQIIASILDTARYGATKTKIMYVSFLSFNQLQKYLNYVLKAGLVDLNRSTGKYQTTNKGLVFLKQFEEVQSMENNMMEKKRALSETLDGAGI